jgi:immune inhibitor A
VVGVACCCLAAFVIGLGTYYANRPPATPVLVTVVRPTHAATAPANFFATVAPRSVTTETLQALEDATIPPSDLREEAMRLKGIANIPITPSLTAANYPLGTELPFFVSNTDTQATFTITARLLYKTANAYFFSDDSVGVDQQGVQSLMDTFQNPIYPTDLGFFGSQWTPGVPGDPRLYIL